MLMTKLKSEEVIGSLASGKVFIINCHGCKEVGFPEEEAKALIVSGFADNVSKELPLEYAVEMNNLIHLEMKGSIG